MGDTWIDEFLTVVKYMNISRAALELNMSQSSLSRHLKQMEQSLGFSVFELRGGRIALTPSGVELADGLPGVLALYQNLIRRCNEISQTSYRTLMVQNPPYSDKISEQYLSFLYSEINAAGLTRFEFVTASRQPFWTMLLNQKLDVAVVYTYETDKNEAVRRLEENGLSSRFLALTPLGIWLPKSHAWAEKESLSIDQLSDLTVLFPRNSDHPLKQAYSEMMFSNGFKPKIKEVNNIRDRFDFMSYRISEGALIFPRSMQDDFRIKWREDLSCIPLDDSLSFSGYAVTNKESGLF